MEINGKVHLFFEQSGVFKNEFKKLGYEAVDVDIQNNFGETDHIIDLFNEIEQAYSGGVSIFDTITCDDLIMAFFPCIYFETMQIIENPSTQPNYLIGTQNFPNPSIIDKNRMLRGDYFKKPTGYWYINCKPTYGESYQPNKQQKIISKCKQGKQAGVCSEERSMIHPDYARNFICDFILGKKQEINQLQLF